MRDFGHLIVWLALICLSGCSRMGFGSSPAELFKLRAECANQSRLFEADWRRVNGSDFQVLTFQNHYNQRHGRCFVHIYYGHAELNMETVYDALEGVGKPPLVLLVGGDDKAANETKNTRIWSQKLEIIWKAMKVPTSLREKRGGSSRPYPKFASRSQVNTVSY